MPIGRAYRLCPDRRLPSGRDGQVRARVRADHGDPRPVHARWSSRCPWTRRSWTSAPPGTSTAPAIEIARQIRARIRAEVGLTASAGVAPNKFLAKIASDLRKPDGLVEVSPGEEATFLRDLPLRRLWGVGPSAERDLAALGARTIGDLVRLGRARLKARLGASGAHLWELAQGIDDRPVVPWHDPKSIGAEETFGRDTRDVARIRTTLLAQADRVATELRADGTPRPYRHAQAPVRGLPDAHPTGDRGRAHGRRQRDLSPGVDRLLEDPATSGDPAGRPVRFGVRPGRRAAAAPALRPSRPHGADRACHRRGADAIRSGGTGQGQPPRRRAGLARARAGAGDRERV